MQYIIRYTTNPVADIERGWSGWMGMDYATLAEAAEELCQEYDLTEDEAETLLERRNHDVRWDVNCKRYRAVHHDGLSCYALEADDEAAAWDEARTQATGIPTGEGDMTEGAVSHLGRIADHWHLFRCKSTWTE